MLEKTAFRLGLFWLLACAWSWPFMFWFTRYPESWRALPLPGFLKTSLFMWGPGIAAVVLYLLARGHGLRRVTFTGTRLHASLAFYLVPLLLLALAAVFRAGPQQALLVLLLLLPVGYFNTLGEELGWRGFAQDATAGLPLVGRFLLVGVLWELWHLPIRLAAWEAAGWSVLSYSGMTLVLAFVLGLAVRHTASLTVAVTLHFWANAVREAPGLLGLEPRYVYGVLGISVLYWAWLLFRWPDGRAAAAATD